jgi:hypothetical protein
MRAFKIDVYEDRVYQVQIEPTLQDLYRHMNCTTVERVPIDRHHDLWLDEEGRVQKTGIPQRKKFTYSGVEYVGNAIILGTNSTATKMKDCTLDIEFAKNKIKFL